MIDETHGSRGRCANRMKNTCLSAQINPVDQRHVNFEGPREMGYIIIYSSLKCAHQDRGRKRDRDEAARLLKLFGRMGFVIVPMIIQTELPGVKMSYARMWVRGERSVGGSDGIMINIHTIAYYQYALDVSRRKSSECIGSVSINVRCSISMISNEFNAMDINESEGQRNFRAISAARVARSGAFIRGGGRGGVSKPLLY